MSNSELARRVSTAIQFARTSGFEGTANALEQIRQDIDATASGGPSATSIGKRPSENPSETDL